MFQGKWFWSCFSLKWKRRYISDQFSVFANRSRTSESSYGSSQGKNYGGCKKRESWLLQQLFWFCFQWLSFTVSQMINKISAQLETPKLRCAAWLLVTHALTVPFLWLWQVMFTAIQGHQVKMPSTLFTPSITKAELPEMLVIFLYVITIGGVEKWKAEFVHYHIQ